MTAITIENLSKNYKKLKALDNLSLEIKKGETFGLLGVNGAGKSTIIKILCGLTQKSDGKVSVYGYNLEQDLDKIKEIINLSPQETAVANNLTVRENLCFFANVYNNNNEQYIDELV